MEHILVIESHRDSTHILAERWLPTLGYRAKAAHNTAAAQELLTQHTFNLVVLDLQPDAHGIEQLKTIRSTYPQIPILMITPQDAGTTVVQAFEQGIRHWLVKPFTLEELRLALESALREQRLQQQNEQLTSSLRQRIHELIILSAIGRSVTRAIELDEVLLRIVEAATHLSHAEEAFLLLMDDDQLVVRAARFAGDESAQLVKHPIMNRAFEQMMRTRQLLRLTEGSSLEIQNKQMLHSALFVPLLAGDESLGILGVANAARRERFSEEQERSLAALSDYAAIAIKNARLFAAQQRSEARYRDLFRNASDLLFVIDPHLCVMEFNGIGARLLEYDEPQIVGQPLKHLIAEEHWPALQKRLQRILADATDIVQFEFELSKQGGQRLPVELSARLIQHKDEQPMILCTVHDLSDRLLQTQIAHAERLAAIEQVVAGIAHELNNPLASISGYTQLLLRDRSLQGAMREDVEHVLAQSRRAAQIVQNLAMIGHDLQINYSSIDMSKLVASTLDLQSTHGATNIQIVRDLSPSLPSIHGDPYQLQQIVLQVVNNAIRAMQCTEGTLHVRTYCLSDITQISIPQPASPLPTQAHGAMVVTEIIDTGIGIPAHHLGHIFDPFWTTKEAGQGSGLGLSMSRNMIAKHHGHIWAHSIINQGTTIYIALPTAEALKERQGNIAAPGKHAADTEQPPQDTAPFL